MKIGVCVLMVTSGIRLGCTDFPRKNGDDVGLITRDNGVELLRIDDENSPHTLGEVPNGYR